MGRVIKIIILMVMFINYSNQQIFDRILTSFSTNSTVKNNNESDIDSLMETNTISDISNYLNPLNWFPHKEKTKIGEEYNPDTDLNTPEIAIRHGYAAETHTVKTEDGYLLTLHRIPCGRCGCSRNGRGTGQPVFLQHGLLSSSADWLLSGPDKALAFILADLGYDVWLGNARGNTYSRKHVDMSNEDSRFWEFSWHEMALYDIPAEIDYIYNIRGYDPMNITENNLLYIGHSMGTTMAFALLSTKPEYNHKIKALFALAPVAYMTEIISPLRLLAPFSKDIELVIKFLGAKEFLPQNKVLRWLAKYGCELTNTERYICENAVFVLCGFDKDQYNSTLMPVIFGHTPAGTSTKTVVHYAQEIHSGGHFQYFDYGKQGNLQRYKQETPPQYDISNINVPIAFFYATNDWLADPNDVTLLYNHLSKTSIGMFKVPYDKFNHVDFMWGNDAPNLVYKPLINLMQRYTTI